MRNFKLTLLIVEWLKGFGVEPKVTSRTRRGLLCHDNFITFGDWAISVRKDADIRVVVYPGWTGVSKLVVMADPEDPEFFGKVADCLGLVP